MHSLDNEQITILIADGHELTRLGLCTLIDARPTMYLLDNTHCIGTLLRIVKRHSPDVILLDRSLSDRQSLQQLISNNSAKILILTMEHDDQTLLELFQSGVAGVVSKNLGSNILIKAIEAVHAGELWFDRQLMPLLRTQYSTLAPAASESQETNPLTANFTPRECSVACLAMKGLPAKKIGQQLGISDKTVRNQLTVIYEKLGINGQVELCLKAPQLHFCRLAYSVNDRDKCPCFSPNPASEPG